MDARERSEALSNHPTPGRHPEAKGRHEAYPVDERGISELSNDLECMSLSAPTEPHNCHSAADELGLISPEHKTARHDKLL